MKKEISLVLAVAIVIGFAQLGYAEVVAGIEKSAERPSPAVVKSATSVATVVGIDYEARTGTLMLSDGKTVTFSAGPEVRNFDQMKVGDRVLIRD